MSVEIGQPAPDFTLSNQFGERVTLSDYRGEKNVLLMFYPFAFTGTCTGELSTIRDHHVEFVNGDCVVLSVSCDSHHTLRVYSDQEGFTHHLLSDFWPHGAVSVDYGVFVDSRGFATRGSFLIDKAGVVRWSVVNGPGEARNAGDYIAALAELS